MTRRTSMKDIAQAAGVSIATVSRVLNNKPDVTPATRDRVIAELGRSDYRLRPRDIGATAQLIGFVNNYRQYGLENDYVGNLLAGCQERAESLAYSLVLIDADSIQKEMRWPGRYGVFDELDGLVWSMPVFDATHRTFLTDRAIPHVVINNITRGVSAPLIESDNMTAIRQGVEYLVGMGHTKIGLMGGALEIANMADRYNGYLTHMKEFGLTVEPDWVIDDLSRPDTQGAIEGTYRLLGRRNLPTALICITATIARGVYRVFAQRGVRIPDDISILAFDDTPLSEVLQPSITTFRQPLQAMGRRAVDVLMDLIDDPDSAEPPPHIREPLTLIVRESVATITDEP